MRSTIHPPTLGVVMDPIEKIKIHKDTTFAILLAAQAAGWPLRYLRQEDLIFRHNRACGRMRSLQVQDNPADWFELGEEEVQPLDSLAVILMRKDPPFDQEYLYSTYLLEAAEQNGSLVVNRPQSLRDANEKLFALQFPQCCPPTLVSRRADELQSFLQQHGDIILKPLDAMGGTLVFRVRQDDPNTNVIIETLTHHGKQSTMAQRFIPEISFGDKRILMVDGEPVPYALARIPAPGETRGNLAAGGRGEGVALSERDHWIAAQVGPVLRQKGILFAGLDVIGDYLTEINITSPTCVRELDQMFDLNIGQQLVHCIMKKLS